MEVQNKAYDLVAYTIGEVGKEKVVSKRNRWSLGSRLIDAALSLAGHIDMANSMMLSNPDEARERKMEQRLALADTYRMMTLVQTARRLANYEEQKHVFWTGQIAEEQELLRGWIESDGKRIKNGLR